mgnify:CR=1 FL=1
MNDPKCGYCDNSIWHSAVWSPECLPADIPPHLFGDDEVAYHPGCWRAVIDDARQEIALKHGVEG